MLYLKEFFILLIASTICSAISDTEKNIRVIASSLSMFDKELAAQWKGMTRDCVGRIACRELYGKMKGDMVIVANGLKAGARVVKGVKTISEKSLEVLEVMLQIGGNFHPYIAAVSSVASLIGVFGKDPGLDNVIELLKGGFSNLEKRFDQLENKFVDLEALIIKQHQTTRLYSSMNALIRVRSRVLDYFSSPSPERIEDLIDYFSALYDAIISIKKAFEGALGAPELCKSLIKVTKVDRGKVMRWLVDLFRRMIQGVSDYVLIAKLKDRPDLSTITTEMTGRLDKVMTRIDNCDKEIENIKWLEQWQVDLGIVLGKVQLGRRKQVYTLARTIYDKLSKKYYWRDWLVVVYRKIGKYKLGTTKKQYVRTIKHRARRRKIPDNWPWGRYIPDNWHTYNWKKRYSIHVASIPKKNPVGYITRRPPYDAKLKFKIGDSAKRICDDLGHNCRIRSRRSCPYPIFGAFRVGVEHAVIAPSNRKFLKKIKLNMCKKKKSWWGKTRTKCYDYKYWIFVLG